MDIDRVLMNVKFEAFAKSYVTGWQWANPKPRGQALEMTPRTDLSDVRVGDLVEVGSFLGETSFWHDP